MIIVTDSSSGMSGFRLVKVPPCHGGVSFWVTNEPNQANGPLTSDNVFEYFATSMFYDKQSNNQVLRMQTMHTGVPIANESEELK
jgi:mediator of RNA polymerase II transcription subunit 6